MIQLTRGQRRRVWVACLAVTGGCAHALDQDRPTPTPKKRPTTGPVVATADLGTAPPLPGMTPPPKPFVDTKRFKPTSTSGQPSTLLLTHASPNAPVPLSAYGSRSAHSVSDFKLSPDLTEIAVRRQFGLPAGVAGIDEPWAVYRLTFNREIWLHFAPGNGTLLAADLVRGAEDGYVRERLYPTR